MPTMAWISIAGMIVAAWVALHVAAKSRQQARQIEAHREDPTIPLEPPRHPFECFLKTYGVYIAFLIFDVFVLERDMHKTTPITRGDVLYIVLDVVAIIAMIVAAAWTFFLNRVLDLASKTTDILEAMGRYPEREAAPMSVPDAKNQLKF